MTGSGSRPWPATERMISIPSVLVSPDCALCYNAKRNRETFTGNPPYSTLPYSAHFGSAGSGLRDRRNREAS